MQTDSRLGTFAGIAALFPADSARLATAVRSLIIRLDSDTFEVPRLGEKTTTYGVGPSKMKHAYCYIMPQNSYVNLGFFRGTMLPDPSRILEGSGKMIRHIKIRNEQQLEMPEVLQLLRSAIAERKGNENPA